MARDLTDLQRLCLKLASANRIAEGLPPLKFRVGFDDVRLRLRWEPGSPRWISWAKAVAALGCLDDRRVWKAGDDASFATWRAAATEDAIGRGFVRDSLDALDPEPFALEVAARSPILGVDAYRRAGQRPYSPPFATMAEAERVAEALGWMGVPALAFANVEAEWPDQIGFNESDLYGWEVLIAGFGFDKQRRMVGGRPAATTYEAPEWLASRAPRNSVERRDAFLAGKRRPCRYRELFDISGAEKARYGAAKASVGRAFDRLADLGLARVGVSWGWPPGIKLTDAGMAEARSRGAGLALARAGTTPLGPPRVDGPDPTLGPEERIRRADLPIPRPGSDPDRLAVLAECMENGTIGDPLTEWPHNLISRWTVVDETGAISRLTLSPSCVVDPIELASCRRLAEEAAGLMAGVDVGMGSAGSDEFAAFFIAATTEGAFPRRIDEELIRSRFGGTIFPMANILVEPVAEEGRWWGEATYGGDMSGVDELAPWRAMMRWFREHREFVDVAFVSIGDGSLSDLLPDEKPPETELVGCVWPRLVLGLTGNGSLAGIFGVTVRA